MGVLREILGGTECAIVAGIGGGGDIASTVLVGEALRREGARVVYAAIVWERFVRDPEPGPIPLDSMRGYYDAGEAVLLLPGCYAVRGHGVVVPSACRFARVLGEPVGFLDASRGEAGVRGSLEALASLYGCDTVVGVDVGGDVLAEGWEDELWSPLADSLGLAAIAGSTLDNSVLVVHSPGSDGELSRETVFERIARIASRGGLLGAMGVPAVLAGLLEEVVGSVGTEAGRPALLAFRGYKGYFSIRGGTRRVKVDPCSIVAFFLDARRAYSFSPLAQAVSGTSSIWEANIRLNGMGVYTEMDLELDLLGNRDAVYSPSLLLEMRASRKRRRALGAQ